MRTCSFSGCDKPSHARTFCVVHYWRLRVHGDPAHCGKRGVKFGTERPNTKHATTTPSLRDIEWAAGFIEGEGCFGRCVGSQRMSVNQVNREPVDKLMSLFGGAAKFYAKKRGRVHKSTPSPIWHWYASGSRARGIMMTLYPLMSAKRKGQIRNAMAHGNAEEILPLTPEATQQAEQAGALNAAAAAFGAQPGQPGADPGANGNGGLEALLGGAGAAV